MYDVDKKKFYESATKRLLDKINDMNLAPTVKNRAVFFTKLFREAFKYDEIKQYTFVTPANKIWDLGYDSVGFCRASSIAFSIIMGLQDWQLMYIDDSEWEAREPHHYLKHLPSGEFFDITYDQFAINGYTVPYEAGYNAIFGLSQNDTPIRFARALDIDLINILKYGPKGK